MRSPQTAPVRSPDLPLAGMRLAIAYDCLFPWTVGGAERWYRCLAEAAVACGASVTYLTREQWDELPLIPGVEIIAVSRGGDLYDEAGRRLLGPTLRYGAGVLRHLVRHRRSYDIVQVANFPFWSLLAARAALVRSAVPVVVDWHEVWSAGFWREYAGLPVGSIGFGIQRICVALSAHPVTTSVRNGRRLRAAGCRVDPLVLPGYLPVQEDIPTSSGQPVTSDARPYALFAGRHIRDKGIDLLAEVIDELARCELRIDLVIAGDGPGRSALEADIRQRSRTGSARCVGFVPDAELVSLAAGATCVVVPSRREGYGMLVVEATRLGTPVVVADFPENLATDHVEDGVNGFVTAANAPALAAGIRRVLAAGLPLRVSTAEWARQGSKRTIDDSAQIAIENYAHLWAPAGPVGQRRRARRQCG